MDSVEPDMTLAATHPVILVYQQKYNFNQQFVVCWFVEGKKITFAK